MHLQGTLADLTQMPGKEAKPEAAFVCMSKLVWQSRVAQTNSKSL